METEAGKEETALFIRNRPVDRHGWCFERCNVRERRFKPKAMKLGTRLVDESKERVFVYVLMSLISPSYDEREEMGGGLSSSVM